MKLTRMPLEHLWQSRVLDVSVTELLEGRKLDRTSEMNADSVETLVRKTLALSEDTPAKKRHVSGKEYASCAL